MDYREYKPHPFTDMFPLRDGKPLDELTESIRDRGQLEEIVLYQGMVLDGRRRQKAALQAKVKPIYRDFGTRHSDGFSALEFCLAVNLHRRDLSKNERAIAAAKYATMKRGFNQHTTDDDGRPPVSQRKAAERFGTTETQAQRAKKVLSKGTPELQEAMQAEKVSVSDAAKVAGEKPALQRKAVEAVQSGKARTLTEAVQASKGAPAVDAADICKQLDKLSEELMLVKTKDVLARNLALEGLKTARSLVARLIPCAAASRAAA
jgi:ParB-like chromosome segregation protein Spo0J